MGHNVIFITFCEVYAQNVFARWCACKYERFAFTILAHALLGAFWWRFKAYLEWKSKMCNIFQWQIQIQFLTRLSIIVFSILKMEPFICLLYWSTNVLSVNTGHKSCFEEYDFINDSYTFQSCTEMRWRKLNRGSSQVKCTRKCT